MNILVAMDSFKGSLTSPRACDAVQRGFSHLPDASLVCVPMADGGEGTAECLAVACGGRMVWETVPDLFGRTKLCGYGLIDGENCAVIETAMAAGIADLKPDERNVLKASTFGVGVQIRNALNRDCKKIIVCLGGSATTDGGMGALQALGVRFYDKTDALIPDGAGGEWLLKVARADASGLVPLSGVEILYACDVTNPLYGKTGAAHVYGPQKGADEETVLLLDEGLKNYARILAETFGKDISLVPGSGAAGGLCGGLLAGLGGTVRSGYDILSDAARLEEKIAQADLVITGEGKTDGQTVFGKLPCKVGETAKKHGVPALVLSGSVLSSARDLYPKGIVAVFDCVPAPMPLLQVMENAEQALEFATENLARLLAAIKK